MGHGVDGELLSCHVGVTTMFRLKNGKDHILLSRFEEDGSGKYAGENANAPHVLFHRKEGKYAACEKTRARPPTSPTPATPPPPSQHATYACEAI